MAISTATDQQPTLHLVLASASPRRRELLGYLGAGFTALATDAEEQEEPTPAPVLAALPALDLPRANHPALLAWRKARAAAELLPNAVILGADTIVVLDDDVLNKPRDEADAREMLARLSGRTHTVYTGMCVITRVPGPGAEWAPIHNQHFVALDMLASRVEIAPLSAGEIAAYVATGEPLDKAGAYGIQGLGSRFVAAVEGDLTCVIGLPMRRLRELLVEMTGHDPMGGRDLRQAALASYDELAKLPPACLDGI